LIVGDGHLRSELEAQARAAGLDGRVIFTGFRGDAASFYADFDVVALTSLNEGTPMTLIEAMGCGRAVASTEVGGVADLMGRRRETLDGFTIWEHGVTAPSRDVEAFTNGLRYLIERPGLRREMGERGRAFVLSRLSKERLIGDMENLYCGLMAEIGRE
jgi:glycosyltransferase involved in cell wall biosynthesis